MTQPLNWTFEPTVMIGLLLLSVDYALAIHPLRRRLKWGAEVSPQRQATFHLGTFCVFIALVTPLDELADDYLFSAHMIQHLLLMLIAPPLWLMGTPEWLVEKLLPIAPSRVLVKKLSHPLAAFILFNTVMWFWHLPRFYDAALENPGLHILSHLTYMAAGVIGWSPVVGHLSKKGEALSLPGKSLYLFLLMISCTALAALITLAPRLLYHFYANRSVLMGLPPLADQQFGGLLMWIPADMVFMITMLGILARWLGVDESSIDTEPDASLVEAGGMH